MLGFTGAAVPGPMFTLALGESAKRGFIAGPLIVAGHAILEIALVFGLAFGLLTVLGEPRIINGLAVIGGLIIVGMGVLMIKGSGEVSLDGAVDEARKRSITPSNPVVGGAIVSAANPYWAIWWVGVASAYFQQVSVHGAIGYATFFTGHILADLIWFGVVAFVVATGRKLAAPQTYRWLIIYSGVFLIILGVFFVYSGLNPPPDFR